MQNEKETYMTPETEVVEVKTEGIICSTDPQTNPGSGGEG